MERRKTDRYVYKVIPKSDTCNQQPEIMSRTELELRKRVSYSMKFNKDKLYYLSKISTCEQTMHWFANVGFDEELRQLRDSKRRSLYDEDSLDGDHPNDKQGRESAGSGKDVDRVKLVRDRQNEERLRKLEELKQQALSAQRFREQREVERRRRIDELRSRDTDR
ncbi:hypothetical protein PV327_008410 [Microctonus hyperodae]|uniref:Uncharacterized protein n=1 Tax=Microctonus hyperodae TaxID=165561 RepID=A0AA39F336_MICHY|nr:hypothetical protein PV327_008410 [Microctonus hyperodae]